MSWRDEIEEVRRLIERHAQRVDERVTGEPEWYRGAADIPGFDYAPPVSVDRASLGQLDAVPRLRRYMLLADGPEYEQVTWTAGGETFEHSPARQAGQASVDDTKLSTDQVLRRLATALELPGEPNDYYAAFVLAISTLGNWKRRRFQPDIVQTVERLAWSAIALLRACPAALWGRNGVLKVPDTCPFWTLEALCRQEGVKRR